MEDVIHLTGIFEKAKQIRAPRAGQPAVYRMTFSDVKECGSVEHFVEGGEVKVAWVRSNGARDKFAKGAKHTFSVTANDEYKNCNYLAKERPSRVQDEAKGMGTNNRIKMY